MKPTRTLTLSLSLLAFTLACLLAGPPAADAGAVQTDAAAPTREALLRARRADKAKSLHAFVPDKLEALSSRVENEILPALFTPKTGFYPRFGSITQAGGFAIGPGYRKHTVFGQPGDLFLSGAYSIKHYWIAEARLVLPELAHRRLFTEAYARRTNFPSQGYYGLGNGATLADYTSFDQNQTTVGGKLGVRLGPVVSVGGGAEYLNPSIGRGRKAGFPSIEQTFTEATAPGLTAQPNFVQTFAFANIDYGQPIGSPRNGGRYRFQVGKYDDLGSQNRYGFTRTDIDLQQYFSAFNERRVLALRSLMSFSDADSGADVPFYFQNTLGGNNTLRGFRDFRFRDRNLLLLQAEYRLEVFTAMDAALFYDAGQVAPRREDLSLSHLRKDYGIGLRFGTDQGVFLRFDIAFGSGEGVRPFIAFSHVF
jgi:outer membrane protein assembly factor BamA